MGLLKLTQALEPDRADSHSERRPDFRRRLVKHALPVDGLGLVDRLEKVAIPKLSLLVHDLACILFLSCRFLGRGLQQDGFKDT